MQTFSLCLSYHQSTFQLWSQVLKIELLHCHSDILSLLPSYYRDNGASPALSSCKTTLKQQWDHVGYFHAFGWAVLFTLDTKTTFLLFLYYTSLNVRTKILLISRIVFRFPRKWWLFENEHFLLVWFVTVPWRKLHEYKFLDRERVKQERKVFMLSCHLREIIIFFYFFFHSVFLQGITCFPHGLCGGVLLLSTISQV